MPDYRVYCLNGAGRIELADWISAPDDDDAVQQARLMKKDAIGCEIWLGRRLVASLNHEGEYELGDA